MAYVLLSLEELLALQGTGMPVTPWQVGQLSPRWRPLLDEGEWEYLDVPYRLNGAPLVRDESPGPTGQTFHSSLSISLIPPLLLVVSGLSGALAIVSALGVWPAVAAANLGLDESAAFYLLAGGVYTVATVFYVIWQTQFLQNLDQLPADVWFMVCLDLLIGGAVILAVGIALLATIILLVLLVGLGMLLIARPPGQPPMRPA